MFNFSFLLGFLKNIQNYLDIYVFKKYIPLASETTVKTKQNALVVSGPRNPSIFFLFYIPVVFMFQHINIAYEAKTLSDVVIYISCPYSL